MLAMNKDKLITVMGSILGALLLALPSVVGWIASQVWDMHPQVTETARRVDRIVDVLPDVKVRIAREDLTPLLPMPMQRDGRISGNLTMCSFMKPITNRRTVCRAARISLLIG